MAHLLNQIMSMTKAEEILKQLDLDYETVDKDESWIITPKDFLSEIKIVLIVDLSKSVPYTMFIWKDDSVQKECKFNLAGNITDIYSFLYNYDFKNFKNKTKLQHGNMMIEYDNIAQDIFGYNYLELTRPDKMLVREKYNEKFKLKSK